MFVPAHPGTSRFAPSTTGPAHPGTLLAALLCWLDARSRGARVLLRLEDLDPERCRPEYARAMVDDLNWLGLEWDVVIEQHDLHRDHVAAMDQLADSGLLYPCGLSRKALIDMGRRAPDGGWAHDNRQRGRPLPPGGWRSSPDPIRARLPDGCFDPHDEGGLVLVGDPARDFGDPIVRRRDGAFAYNLVVVVDDALAGVDRIVRGRDIAPSTALHMALQHTLGLPTPTYRHHLLLLEERTESGIRKLAKLHGSIGAFTLRRHSSAAQVCGFLAWCAGLIERPYAVSPTELLATFSWDRARRDDVLVHWDGKQLIADIPAPTSPIISADSAPAVAPARDESQ